MSMASYGLLTRAVLAVLVSLIWSVTVARAQGMFTNRSALIPQGTSQLNYGVAVTNVGDGEGPMEWVVAGFSGANLVLQYDQRTGKYRNIAEEDWRFADLRDTQGAAIGVCACDIDGDGLEEIYFLNTNNRYSGPKLVRDRLFKWRNNRYEDLFSDDINSDVSSMYSGRSVACVDRTGSGKYGILLATYAQDKQGQFGLIEMNENHPSNDVARGKIVLYNVAAAVGIDFTTGGRGITVGPIIGDDGFSDVYFVNEGNPGLQNRGDNALFVNDGQGRFTNMAAQTNLNDAQPGRGVTLADFNNDGNIDIVYGNWMGPHRLQIQQASSSPPTFFDAATLEFAKRSPIRTVIAADFDNSGNLNVFMNNIVYRGAAPNKLFKILPEGASVGIVKEDIGDAEEPTQHGTGAAVADIDNDGVLELLVAHGESKSQGLTFYHVTRSRVEGNRWLRVLPLTQFGAPARGAKVSLMLSDGRMLTRVVDGGSGYLCEMEPVAHFGLGRDAQVRELKVVWPDNHEVTKRMTQMDENKMIEISHTGSLKKIEPVAYRNMQGYETEIRSYGRDSATSQARRGYPHTNRSRDPYRLESRSRSRTSSSYNSRRPSNSSRANSASGRGDRRNQRLPYRRTSNVDDRHNRRHHPSRHYHNRGHQDKRVRDSRRPTAGPPTRVPVSRARDTTPRNHIHRTRHMSRAELERRRQEQLERAREIERRREQERSRNVMSEAERRRRWEEARRARVTNTRETAPRGIDSSRRRNLPLRAGSTTEDPRESLRRLVRERARANARAEARRRAAYNARRAAEKNRRRNVYSSRGNSRVRVTSSTSRPYQYRSREYYRRLAQQRREAARRAADNRREAAHRAVEERRRNSSRSAEMDRTSRLNSDRNAASRRQQTAQRRYRPRYRPTPRRVTMRPEITTQTTVSPYAYAARRRQESRNRERYWRPRPRPTPDAKESHWGRRMDSRRRYTHERTTTPKPTHRSYSVDRNRYNWDRSRPERYRASYRSI
ncbi:cartilage acidic protein 1 [Elysia marginata]|uniref:Cartilage acidic protein 1 n=1 Tax=Elysia marginata TaxID=1093978 RepID=A0AAV4HFK1_9GAST|nr:cartilage acidic protein 1 [Elysia marginata]